MPDTIAPYSIRVPKDSELADVPTDLTRLATDVTTALNGKLTRTDADLAYQKKIWIETTPPSTPPDAKYAENDIVFVVP